MVLATATMRKRLKKNEESKYLSDYFVQYKRQVHQNNNGGADNVGKRFFRKMLRPRVQRIVSDMLGEEGKGQGISTLAMAYTLNKQHAEWIPVALSIYETAGVFADEDGSGGGSGNVWMTDRLAKLAKLEVYFMLTGTPAKDRFARCMDVLHEIASRAAVGDGGALELTDAENDAFVEALRGDFSKPAVPKVVLWALNEYESLTVNSAPMRRGTALTLEHCLPQKPGMALRMYDKVRQTT